MHARTSSFFSLYLLSILVWSLLRLDSVNPFMLLRWPWIPALPPAPLNGLIWKLELRTFDWRLRVSLPSHLRTSPFLIWMILNLLLALSINRSHLLILPLFGLQWILIFPSLIIHLIVSQWAKYCSCQTFSKHILLPQWKTFFILAAFRMESSLVLTGSQLHGACLLCIHCIVAIKMTRLWHLHYNYPVAVGCLISTCGHSWPVEPPWVPISDTFPRINATASWFLLKE